MAIALAEMQEHRDELYRSLAAGVLRVTYNGRTTEFRSREDMERTLARLDRDIAAASGGGKRVRQVYSPGTKHL
jgi:hypothetical protein